MTCPHCSTTTKLQKEVKYWKERYFIEKKSLSCVIQWVLGVFGFAVKVDVDKESLGIRIEGRENKDAMSAAVFPPTMTDNKITLLMEDRMVAEDFVEDPEEISGLELALASEQVQEGDQTQAQVNGGDAQMNIQGDKNNPPQQQQLDASGNQTHHDAQVILDILRSYEDSSGQQQPSYIILKDGHETIPVQLDCTQFLNGDFSTTTSGNGKNTILMPNSQQIVYRLSTGELANAQVAEIVPSKKPPATNNCKGTTQKQSQKYSPPNKKTKTYNASLPTSPHLNSSSMTVTGDGIKIEGLEGSDFGLTLRERAQVYVQTKAMEVIKKTSQGYTCIQCSPGYSFTSVENALTHTKTHFEGRPYKCEFRGCDETFAIQKVYLQHRKSHYPRKSNLPKTSSVSTKQSVFLSPRTVIPSSIISEPVGMKPPTKDSLSNKQLQQQNFGQPGPGNKNKQFKCTVPKCEWSYGLANELEWHMKAHSQSRV